MVPAPPSLPRVVVCGLGPATPDLLTGATVAAIERLSHRFLRTRRHPAAKAVGGAVTFDDLYERADTIDQVYDGIVERLVDAAVEYREVLYAVPGSPTVAEATVERLLGDRRVAVEVLPGLSFLDLAWTRLGLDPQEAGVRLVDGHRFTSEAAGQRGPLLVSQCDRRDVLSAVKLALADVDVDEGGLAGGPATVTVLQRLGLPDEAVFDVTWAELDRVVEPDHLTSLYVPRLAAPVAGELALLYEVIRRLRVECPWDREQTHHTLRRHLLEEAYEVIEAIDHLDVEAAEGYGELEEELGDLLIQVMFHSTLAAEQGQFELSDVARTVRDKMIGRHPHVFGDAEAETADDVRSRWDQMKKAEKQRASVMEGIPVALPALLYALKVQKRAASENVNWRDLVTGEPASQLGMRLFDLVDEARRAGLDPETELRLVADRLRHQFDRQYQ